MLLSLHRSSSSSAMMPDGSGSQGGRKKCMKLSTVSTFPRLFVIVSLALIESIHPLEGLQRHLSRASEMANITLEWSSTSHSSIRKWCGDLSRLESAQLNSHSLVLSMRSFSAIATNSTVFPDSFLLLWSTQKRCSFSTKKSSMCWRKICRFPEESRQLPSMALLCWELAEKGRERESKTLDNIRSSSNDSTQVVDCSWRCSWVEICVWHSKKKAAALALAAIAARRVGELCRVFAVSKRVEKTSDMCVRWKVEAP